jgi:hypothetical protein
MDADAYPQEVLAEEEPKYLRRQKPVEIRRRKFGKKAWKTYARVSVLIVAALAVAGALYAMGDFLFRSPQMSLLHPDQVAIHGNHYVTRASVLEVFSVDRGRSASKLNRCPGSSTPQFAALCRTEYTLTYSSARQLHSFATTASWRLWTCTA